MKFFFIKLAFLVCVLILIPVLLLVIFTLKSPKDLNSVTVYNTVTKEIMTVNTEEYIVNVVAAEMPLSFNEEALKAQAVAARTYAMRKINKDFAEHHGADLCTDYAHCQAYLSDEELKAKWENSYDDNMAKVKKCVESTAGEYLSYDGSPISAVFHSCSDGKTENASDVWGGEVPYLVSVDSPGDTDKKDFITEVSFDKADVISKLQNEYEDFESDEEIKVDNFVMSDGGNVLSLNICGKNIKGTDVRRIFDLKSTSFTAVFAENKLTFTVYGNGHGVGMSQYGANHMANDGKTYDEILLHYYPGTILEKEYKND